LGRSGAAKIVGALRRIGADDQEIAAGGNPLVPGAGGQHRNIACFDVELLAGLAAEAHAGAPRGDAQNLVDHRMEMRERIDAVARRIAPAALGEGALDDAGRILPASVTVRTTRDRE